ncbi:MAG: serine hydrolase [Myxococcales bacterium]|nr:serine hydrolase [Myxococcales bacterium]
MRAAFGLLFVLACGSSPHLPAAQPSKPAAKLDPDGPHREVVTAQVRPYIDAEIASGLVIGLYDAGNVEIYGFGKGPGSAPPNGNTLFEIGSVTKVYTGLLLADAVQRREVELDQPVAELLPPGITMPMRDKIAITLRQLALHNSGLPRLPPGIAKIADAADPYARYSEDLLYADLVQTKLEATPGTAVLYSNYGFGLLGFALGRKIGGSYQAVLAQRVLTPLGLADTYFAVPATQQARVAQGTNGDLAPVPPWKFDALAGAGALISTVRDQLRLVDAELDSNAGGKGTLRAQMHLTQEPQLEHTAANEGLGWQIDNVGRYWHNGGTGGFHSFVGFDPKTKRGVVILASTATSLIDHLADNLYKVLAKEQVASPRFATAAEISPFAGSYDLQGSKLKILTAGKRLYVDGPGVPRFRLLPISDHEFWIEELQTVAVFEREADKVARIVFVLGEHRMSAPRVEEPRDHPESLPNP